MFERSLLTKLSRRALKALNLYLTQGAAYDDAKRKFSETKVSQIFQSVSCSTDNPIASVDFSSVAECYSLALFAEWLRSIHSGVHPENPW
jgi:hypothetical protein